jgi:hypothetical protein
MSALPKAIQLPGKPKLQTVGPSLLEKLDVVIGHELDTVWFELGGQRLTMDYKAAAKLGFMLRTHAKQAKKYSGDHGAFIHAEGLLTDAEMNYKKGW